MIYRYVGLKPREGHDYMEQLSDFRILDFCEWIKNSVLDKAQYSDINMWDLLFNENYNDFLMRKAKEYCEKLIAALVGLTTIAKFFNLG